MLLLGAMIGLFAHLNTKTENAPVSLVQTAQAEKPVDLKIKGNKNSKIFHLKGCPNYNDIADRNVIWFKTSEEAEAAGYRVARNC